MTKTIMQAKRREMRAQTMAEVGRDDYDYQPCRFDKVMPHSKAGSFACCLTANMGLWTVSYWTERDGVVDVWPIHHHLKAVRWWGWLRKHKPDPRSDDWDSLIEEGFRLSDTTDFVPRYPVEMTRQISTWNRLYPFSAITELTHSLRPYSFASHVRAGILGDMTEIMNGNQFNMFFRMTRDHRLTPYLLPDVKEEEYEELTVLQRVALAAASPATREAIMYELTQCFLYANESEPESLAQRSVDRVERWIEKARGDTATKQEWHREKFNSIRGEQSSQRWTNAMDSHARIMRSIGIELE